MKNLLAIILILAISISVNAQKVLFLDAGHGGKDLGAITASGVSEAEINQLFVKEIKELAEAKGIKVVLLSDAQKNVPLNERTKKVNEFELKDGETAVLISIHANFSENNPALSGPEVMVMPASERSEGSWELATKMETALGAKLLVKRLSILSNITQPAILIETGYLSNEQEGMDLQMPDMRTVIARKIVSVL